MNRTYLEEDLHLIQKYFPGARPVAPLRTPFDLTDKPARAQAISPSDTFRDDEPSGRWYGDVAWSR